MKLKINRSSQFLYFTNVNKVNVDKVNVNIVNLTEGYSYWEGRPFIPFRGYFLNDERIGYNISGFNNSSINFNI